MLCNLGTPTRQPIYINQRRNSKRSRTNYFSVKFRQELLPFAPLRNCKKRCSLSSNWSFVFALNLKKMGVTGSQGFYFISFNWLSFIVYYSSKNQNNFDMPQKALTVMKHFIITWIWRHMCIFLLEGVFSLLCTCLNSNIDHFPGLIKLFVIP